MPWVDNYKALYLLSYRGSSAGRGGTRERVVFHISMFKSKTVVVMALEGSGCGFCLCFAFLRHRL